MFSMFVLPRSVHPSLVRCSNATFFGTVPDRLVSCNARARWKRSSRKYGRSAVLEREIGYFLFVKSEALAKCGTWDAPAMAPNWSCFEFVVGVECFRCLSCLDQCIPAQFDAGTRHFSDWCQMDLFLILLCTNALEALLAKIWEIGSTRKRDRIFSFC